MIATALLLLAAAPVADPKDGAACRQTRAGNDPVVMDRACLRLGPERVLTGVYVDAFEGQTFVEDGRTIADLRAAKRTSWIDLRRDDLVKIARYPAGYVMPKTYRPRVYRLRFRGAVAPPCRFDEQPPHLCYGHMGGSPRLTVAYEILTAQYLGYLEN